MTLRITENSTAEELGAFELAAIKAGRSDLQRIAYAARMTNDANAIKNPLSKADRFHLACQAFAEAIAEAKLIEEKTGDSGPAKNAMNSYASNYPQYEALSIQCIEAFHEDRLSVLRKSKSGKRQLSSTRVTLKALIKLDGRYHDGPICLAYEKALRYWRDQEMILAAYDE